MCKDSKLDVISNTPIWGFFNFGVKNHQRLMFKVLGLTQNQELRIRKLAGGGGRNYISKGFKILMKI